MSKRSIFSRLIAEDGEGLNVRVGDEDRAPLLEAVAEADEVAAEAEELSDGIEDAADTADEVNGHIDALRRTTEGSGEGITPEHAESMAVVAESINRRFGGKRKLPVLRKENFTSKTSRRTQTLVLESGFVDKLKQIWQAICEGVKRAIEVVKNFIAKMFGGSGGSSLVKEVAEDLKKQTEAWKEATKDYGKSGGKILKDGTEFDFNRMSEALREGDASSAKPAPKVASFEQNAAKITAFYTKDFTKIAGIIDSSYSKLSAAGDPLIKAARAAGSKPDSDSKDHSALFDTAWTSFKSTADADINAIQTAFSTVSGKPVGHGKYIKPVTNDKHLADATLLSIPAFVIESSAEPNKGSEGVTGKGEMVDKVNAAVVHIQAALDAVVGLKTDSDKAVRAMEKCRELADKAIKAFSENGSTLDSDVRKKVDSLKEIITTGSKSCLNLITKTCETINAVGSAIASDLKQNTGRLMDVPEAP